MAAIEAPHRLALSWLSSKPTALFQATSGIPVYTCRCVGKGCDAAVEATVDRGADEPLDIACSHCGSSFCFNCKEDAHRPVSEGGRRSLHVVTSGICQL
jgi:hypothetical protein